MELRSVKVDCEQPICVWAVTKTNLSDCKTFDKDRGKAASKGQSYSRRACHASPRLSSARHAQRHCVCCKHCALTQSMRALYLLVKTMRTPAALFSSLRLRSCGEFPMQCLLKWFITLLLMFRAHLHRKTAFCCLHTFACHSLIC